MSGATCAASTPDTASDLQHTFYPNHQVLSFLGISTDFNFPCLAQRLHYRALLAKNDVQITKLVKVVAQRNRALE